jgi:hypothetical protein
MRRGEKARHLWRGKGNDAGDYGGTRDRNFGRVDSSWSERRARRPRARRLTGGGVLADVFVRLEGRVPVTGGAWARVDGGRRGPACASREARVRRGVRIWSITDVCVMNSTRRIASWQDGHASGSTSNLRLRP